MYGSHWQKLNSILLPTQSTAAITFESQDTGFVQSRVKTTLISCNRSISNDSGLHHIVCITCDCSMFTQAFLPSFCAFASMLWRVRNCELIIIIIIIIIQYKKSIYNMHSNENVHPPVQVASHHQLPIFYCVHPARKVVLALTVAAGRDRQQLHRLWRVLLLAPSAVAASNHHPTNLRHLTASLQAITTMQQRPRLGQHGHQHLPSLTTNHS